MAVSEMCDQLKMEQKWELRGPTVPLKQQSSQQREEAGARTCGSQLGMSLTHVARGRSQKHLKMQHSGVRVPWVGESGRAESPQFTHGSSVSFVCNKCHFVCFVNLPVPCTRRPEGKTECPMLEGSLWGGVVLWDSEWKVVGPGALGASDFPKLFYHDTHVHIYTHTHACAHMIVCVIPFFNYYNQASKHKVPGGVSEVEHNAERRVSAQEEMDEVETRFKLNPK